MKATGIVRRIDDLGRVVIPKEIRRTLRIREGDPLEIFVDKEGEVILKKYSPIGELGEFVQEYTDTLNESTGHVVCVADRDVVVAVSGAPAKDYLEKPIAPSIEKVMIDRKPVMMNKPDDNIRIKEDEKADFAGQVVAPIIAEGDPIGAIIISSKKNDIPIGSTELKLAETAAGFLAKQMEQ